MKKKIADMWVKELRSGDWRQGKRRLEDGQGRMCCLGVLSSMAVAEGVCEYDRDNSGGYFGVVGLTGCPPKEVMKWAGLKSFTGRIPGERQSLIYMNDSGRSFAEIADVIEKNWRRL